MSRTSSEHEQPSLSENMPARAPSACPAPAGSAAGAGPEAPRCLGFSAQSRDHPAAAAAMRTVLAAPTRGLCLPARTYRVPWFFSKYAARSHTLFLLGKTCRA